MLIKRLVEFSLFESMAVIKRRYCTCWSGPSVSRLMENDRCEPT